MSAQHSAWDCATSRYQESLYPRADGENEDNCDALDDSKTTEPNVSLFLFTFFYSN